MRPDHALVAGLAGGLKVGVRALPRPASLRLGGGLGDLVRWLGLRRKVARENLALAFPELSSEARERILVEHYRELGRVACEYPRLPELARAPIGEVVAEVRGMEHLLEARSQGRGVILLTGHFGSFELLGAVLARHHPVDFVVKPMSNPGVERLFSRLRQEAGVGQIPLGSGVRGVFASLRDNRWVAMVADQDARRHGVFVPFFGRMSSTPTGPAEIALRTGAPMIMGFATRRPDGRHELHLLPPFPHPEGSGPEAVREVTARHTALLEEWVRRHPPMWFWLHRRWKTAPPAGVEERS